MDVEGLGVTSVLVGKSILRNSLQQSRTPLFLIRVKNVDFRQRVPSQDWFDEFESLPKHSGG